MSDAAFKTAPFPAYTTAQLREFVADPSQLENALVTVGRMTAEIARRERVEAGDWSVMTPAERLRHIRAAEA